jgi:hypothetical protein
MHEVPYLFDIKISYNNDREYRETLRKIFKMDKQQYKGKISELENNLGSELDIVTIDENEYDDVAADKAMNFIYNLTKKNKEFDKIYELAGYCMFSLDKQIGLAVCFSYDYLILFHECLCEFINYPDKFNESSIHYKYLTDKLTFKK